MEVLMKTKGIRILDKELKVVSVTLLDIIQEIDYGNQIHWSILHLYASGSLGEGRTMLELQKQIRTSDKGLSLSWEELNSLAHKFYEIMDILIIGCRDQKFLQRYEHDQEMYETCDIVIEMADSCYWEIFSKKE